MFNTLETIIFKTLCSSIPTVFYYNSVLISFTTYMQFYNKQHLVDTCFEKCVSSGHHHTCLPQLPSAPLFYTDYKNVLKPFIISSDGSILTTVFIAVLVIQFVLCVTLKLTLFPS